jgi:hypothetical protein
MDALKTLRALANPRFYLVHQNQAQRLRVHVLDGGGAIAVESADDGQTICSSALHEMIAVDGTTHLQTNDAQMASLRMGRPRRPTALPTCPHRYRTASS